MGVHTLRKIQKVKEAKMIFKTSMRDAKLVRSLCKLFMLQRFNVLVCFGLDPREKIVIHYAFGINTNEI